MISKEPSSYHVAFDCGNSSFRVLLGTFHQGRLEVEVVDQISNDPVNVGGLLYWDILRIFDGLKKGLKKAFQKTGRIDTLGITTWGIDFGILSEKGILMANPLCYRNTLGVEAHNRQDEAALYRNWEATGIQNHPMNSLYQIDGIRSTLPEYWSHARRLLFIPDLLIYLFTGEQVTERSIASTSQVYNVERDCFSEKMLDEYDLAKELFAPLARHGEKVGSVSEDICAELSIDPIPFICTPSHDTASAVVAVPELKDLLFLSSGTWSLIGAELDQPILTREVYDAGFTNEAGVFGTTTYLKNATGLYLLQQIKKSLARQGMSYSWADFAAAARDCSKDIPLYDTNCEELFSSQDVVGSIQKLIGSDDTGVVIASTYLSLADCYSRNVASIKKITGKTFDSLHIIGGGSRDRYLNQLTADATGMKVVAGPVEAASIGNICIQKCYQDRSMDLNMIRSLVKTSFETELFMPKGVKEG